MTTIERTVGFETNRWATAALLIGRAAMGLAFHGLMHPLRPAVITRTSGRVVAR